MDLQLSGKRALVTGSTAGIGLAIARSLASEGAAVIVNGRSQARVDEAVGAVKVAAPRAEVTGVALDLATADGARQLIARLPDVDILVNNLGIFEPKPFFDIPDEDWRRFFETNVISGVRLCRHYFPGMLKRNWGRIVFLSSESAINTPVEMIHYGATKTAQLGLSRGLAEMTKGTSVTVNAVLPGPTRSEGVGDFVEGLAKDKGVASADVERDFFAHTRPSSLIQRFATPDEVATLVTYVCSPLAAAVNGAALRVDGGVVRSAF